LACGCEPTFPEKLRDWDVRGEYALVYDPMLAIDLDAGGTLRHQMGGAADTVNLGSLGGQSLTLDLAAFCSACPAQILGTQVAIDQIDPDADLPRHLISLDSHEGVVDHTQQDELAATLAGSGCRPLAVVTGRFSHRGETVLQEPAWQDADGGVCDPVDGGSCTLSAVAGGVRWPGDAPADGIAHGRIGALFPASCAFPGVSGTLRLAGGFAGSRLGDLQPPADAAVATTD
jgi:hypothetical protein